MNHPNISISVSKSFVSIFCSLFIVCILGIPSIYAQGTGTISGEAVDKASGEELLFANVLLEGTTLGTSTDEKGKYIIPQVPAGDYSVLITYVGDNNI